MRNIAGMLICFISLLLCAPAMAAQDLVVEITSGSDHATPIAVSPFHWQGASTPSEDVAQIISDDLARVGQFKLLPREQFLSQPSTPQEVIFPQWKQLAMEYLVVGHITPTAQGYDFEFNLMDVDQQKTLDARRGHAADLRDLAHHVSDHVYEKITGVRGIFSTHILYVTVERPAPRKILYRLQLADADGYRARTIFQSSEPILSPTWAPDGKKVAYVSFHQRKKPAIYIHELTTGIQEKIADYPGINSAPAWSPDGQSIAMSLSKDGNPELYLYHLADKSLTRLTRDLSIDTEPSWFPDSKSLVFTSNRGGSPQLYKLQLADSKIQRLTYEGSYNARGEITESGQYLVMVHRDRGIFHVATQDLTHDTLNVLTNSQLDESPSVAPNGNMIIYATVRGGLGVLAVTSIDGRAKFFLPAKQAEVREPAWSPFR